MPKRSRLESTPPASTHEGQALSRRPIIASFGALYWNSQIRLAISIGSTCTKLFDASIADCAGDPLVNRWLSNSSCFVSAEPEMGSSEDPPLYNLICM